MNVEDILKIEKKYGLYDDEIDGVNYWIYARYRLLQYDLPRLQGKFEGEMHARLANKRSFIKKVPAIIYNMIFRGKIKAKPADICIVNHERRVWENGRFECKYTRKLYEHYGNNCIYLERLYNYGHLRPIDERNFVYLDYISILSTIYYWAIRLFQRKKYKEVLCQAERHVGKALAEIAECYNVKYQLQDLTKRIVQIVYKAKVRKRLFRRLLKKINPKAIVEVVGYSPISMLINEVAHEMGIPSFELQHGLIGEEHFAYNYANENRLMQFPDFILLFGDLGRENVRWPIDISHVLPVGFPYLEEKSSVLKKNGNKDGKKVILFLSQATVGRELSILAYELWKLIQDKQLNIKIIFKLHPGEYLVWKEKYPELCSVSGDSEVQVVDSNKSDLYQLLSQADIQIGVYSTTIVEGLMWGSKTLIYRMETTSSIIKLLCANNIAHYIDNAEDILDYLTGNEIAGDKIETDRLWKRDAVNNILQAIHKEINKDI